jgi:hypothetical protein
MAVQLTSLAQTGRLTAKAGNPAPNPWLNSPSKYGGQDPQPLIGCTISHGTKVAELLFDEGVSNLASKSVVLNMLFSFDGSCFAAQCASAVLLLGAENIDMLLGNSGRCCTDQVM